MLARALTAIATIYLARILGVNAYGVLGFAATIILYFSAVVDWGIELYGPREVADNQQQIASLLPSILLSRLAMSVGLAVCITLIGSMLLPHRDALVLGVYSLFLLSVALNTRWVHLGFEKSGLVALARSIAEVTKVLLILAIIHSPDDVAKVPLALFLGELIYALLLIAWLRRRGIPLIFRFDAGLVQRMYRSALPLMVTTLLALWIDNADLIYLRVFRTTREVGLYLSAYTLINFLGLLGNTSRLSLIPTLTRLGKHTQDQWELYHSAMVRLFALGLPISVGGFLVAPEMIRVLFGSEYQGSAIALRILIWTVPFMLMRSVLASVLVASGQQKRVLQMTSWSMIFSIALNLILVPQIGMLGTAFTTVVTELLRLSIGQYYVLFEGYPLTFIGRFLRPIIAAIVMGGALFFTRVSTLWLALPLGMVGYFCTLAVVGGIRFRRGALPTLEI